ncbi:bifunctional epoxide hydrolase 2 [Colletotrichum spaethianum]|uniref:Bifunctional epoxide hydrolase 2 n=1 Tax=Colletotrichum spaethianum TaxID=700344 RepID=A0AA37L7T7_9PEZI|nr:bifunctional epoxide hydrolase 2 [Colletotrichum spaethianum]GKT41253.1 bifunctional epoxide hydrolase 2 [Colletotrichum spaethianum]
MDLSELTKKTIDVFRGSTYTYYTSPAQKSKLTLILFHRWPDTAHLWGYGITAVDNLGFGESSKPTDTKIYACDGIAADAIKILDAEGINKAISLGHDWGCMIAQRLYNFHPNRVCGLVVMLNVAYTVRTDQFDLDKINEKTKKMFGRGIHEYWHFFTADDAFEIMNQNLESVYAAVFGKPEIWYETVVTLGGMRRFVSEGRTQPTQPFATSEHKADSMERFSKDGGFAAPRCVYTATSTAAQTESDRKLTEEAKTVKVSVLYWGGTRDYVCRPELWQQSIASGIPPNVKSLTRAGGHWAFLERPREFGMDVLRWLQDTFP